MAFFNAEKPYFQCFSAKYVAAAITITKHTAMRMIWVRFDSTAGVASGWA
jgi:hypothetical protein